MTGFSDSPHDMVASSDVACYPYSLSMITNAEQQLLSAELAWVHAFKNVRFPGLLWTLVKSTPGLLGLWAQQIHLQHPLNDTSINPRLAMNLSDLRSASMQVSSMDGNSQKKLSSELLAAHQEEVYG